MLKIASFLLIFILTLVTVQGRIEKRRPYNSSSSTSAGDKRNQALEFLQRSLTVILETGRLDIQKVIDKAAKHAIVAKGRTDMFQAYERFLDRQCKEEDDLEGRKKTVRKGWKTLEEKLFYLDGLDMHNSCFVQGITFPGVAYD